MPNQDLEATKRMFLATYNGLLGRWSEAAARIAGAQAIVAENEAIHTELRAQAEQMQNTALMMGFDLFDAVVNGNADEAMQVISTPRRAMFSIKNFVLEAAKAEHPGPVRARMLRQQLRERGHDIHDKTIGMSLYRWAQRGAIRREGIDWYFVPEDQRSSVEPAPEDLLS
jgi:hypothetical protein